MQQGSERKAPEEELEGKKGDFLGVGGLLGLEIAAPVVGGGGGEAGLDADVVVDLERDGLGSATAAFAFV